jgi:competence protein ComEA
MCVLLTGLNLPVHAQQTLNLNEATIEQLVTLKGIGEKTANKILEYRQSHGQFKSVDELVNVKGVGEKTLETLRAFLTVSGEKTK